VIKRTNKTNDAEEIRSIKEAEARSISPSLCIVSRPSAFHFLIPVKWFWFPPPPPSHKTESTQSGGAGTERTSIPIPTPSAASAHVSSSKEARRRRIAERPNDAERSGRGGDRRRQGKLKRIVQGAAYTHPHRQISDDSPPRSLKRRRKRDSPFTFTKRHHL